jgi:hypothetical protein
MSREKELTAVEWLLEQLDVETVLTRRQLSDVINKAKQMEKEQRGYSKEEVLEHLNILIMMPSTKLDEFTNDEEMVTIKWFEQFKQQEQ